MIDPLTGTRAVPRTARRAVAVVFALYGMLFASAVPRYPQIQEHLALSNGAFGSAIAVYAAGSVLAGLSVAAVIRCVGSALAATLGVVALAAATVLIAAARSWWMLATAFALAGAVDPLIDVAANRQGLRVQTAYGRSILIGFHATWCLGAVVGGLLGSAAAGLHLPLVAHLGGTAILGVLVAAGAYRYLLPDAAGDTVTPAPVTGGVAACAAARAGERAAMIRVVAGLGAIAAIGALIEDAGASWSAIYLTGIGAAAAVAGLGYVALQAAMTVGRLAADRVVDRYGHRGVARAGTLMSAVAMTVALAVQSVPVTVAAFGIIGLGTATLIPAAVHTVDRLPGLPAETGLMVVSWLQRVGGLIAPPMIGVIADTVSLRAALSIVVTVALTAALLATLLTTRADRR